MKNKEPKLIGLLYGGRSVEHDVSIRSAKNISFYIDKKRFEVSYIGIDKQGKWFLTKEVTTNIGSGKPLLLNLDPEHPELIFQDGSGSLAPDLIFPVLHGTNGEDGSVQGLLQATGWAFSGSGVLGSAVSMDKVTTKRLLQQAGIPTSPFLSFGLHQKEQLSFKEIKEALGLPFMVKAGSQGSSVGISKVVDAEGFKIAVDEAYKFDQIVIFEKYIKGRELECAILGNYFPEASRPGEIVISDDYEFYTFEAKYVDGKAVSIRVPASLDEATSELIRTLSVKAYVVAGCKDFARVDLFLAEDGTVNVNEINTLPGFTDASMFPLMWGDAGISFTDLITRIIEIAWARTAIESNLSTENRINLD